MKLKAIPFLLAATVLTACQPTINASAPAIKEADAAITINGEHIISKTALKTLQKEFTVRSRGQKNISQKQLSQKIIQRALLVREAKKKKLDQSAEVEKQLIEMKKTLLTQVAVEDFIKANPVSDADLKAEYEKQVGSKAGGTEFKARHILLKTENEAKAVIAELDKGGDFVELAKNKSTGPSKSKGGDLGWFTTKQMIAPFSEAVAKLENSSYTKAAVKTQYGWHVIIREDSRQQTPMPFEDVKEKLEQMIQSQKLKTYLKSLRQKADVKTSITEESPTETKKVVPVATTTATK